jgi:GT2 family glycosyltransferase
MANVAVLILNYNGEQHLKKFLPSIIKNSEGCEVIVGDNKSTDQSISLLEKEFPEIRVIELDNNYGYAGGYNKLIAQLDHEYIALVNSDIEATPGWLKPLMSILESDSQVAAVQPKILSYINRDTFEHAGAGGGYMDQYGFPFCRGRVFNSLEEDDGQYDDTCDVFWASGACFIIRKSVFDEFDGFDDDFFAHMEEIDLCWKINNGGYAVKYCGESTVYHLGGGTLSYSNPRKTYLNFRNGWMMLIKNSPSESISKLLFTRWWLDFTAVLFFLIRFQLKNAFAVIKAHIYVFQNLRIIQKKRSESLIKKYGDVKMSPSNFSLVWQYYIKGKKRYPELIPD